MHTSVRFWGMGVCVLLAAGCGHDSTGPSTRPVYWRLQLNHHAVTLATVAPYDTIHLAVTPLDVSGAPLTTTARPVYTASDTSVTIDSTGLVRVHWAGSDAPTVTVVATLSAGGTQQLTLADTVFINVVDWSSASAVPRMDSLLFRSVTGDSARRAVVDTTSMLGTQTFDSVVAKTSTGTVIPNVLVRYRSSDSLIAGFPSPASTTAPQVITNRPGVVLLTADATVYGKHKIDSLWYTVGYPLRVVCNYGVGEFAQTPVPLSVNYLSLGQLQVGVGGAVLWANTTVGQPDNSLDIQFDHTTGIAGLPDLTTFPELFGVIPIPAGPGGNISAFPAVVPVVLYVFQGKTYRQVAYDSYTSRARVFTRPGTYRWSSQRQGISGTVIVVSNDSVQSKSSTLPRS